MSSLKKRKFYFFRFLFSIKFIIREFQNKNFKKIFIKIIIFIIIMNNIDIKNNYLKIYFVDVGQGDCTVIQTPNGKNLIIDGGDKDTYDYGEKVVLPYLLDRKIKQIDYLIVSHVDSDHIGRFIYYFRKFKNKKDINRYSTANFRTVWEIIASCKK